MDCAVRRGVQPVCQAADILERPSVLLSGDGIRFQGTHGAVLISSSVEHHKQNADMMLCPRLVALAAGCQNQARLLRPQLQRLVQEKLCGVLGLEPAH